MESAKLVVCTPAELQDIVSQAVGAALKYAPLQEDVPDPEAVFTAQQGADFLQVSLPTYREWDKKGYVKRRTIAGEIRYLKSELIQALKLPEVRRTARRKASSN